MYPIRTSSSSPALLSVSQSQHQMNSRNAYVSELNGYHIPNDEQRVFIKDIVSHYENAESKSSRDEVAKPISEYIYKLRLLRSDVFEVINGGSENVYGRLKETCTEVDRDRYIQKLNVLFELREEIKKVKEYKEFANCGVDDALYIHHSSVLYGDLYSLASIREGHRDNVPNLIYNKGPY